MHNINILDICKRNARTKQLLDGDTALGRSRRETKIDQVQTFFRLILNDISQEELETADEAMKNTYLQFGITEDNHSIFCMVSLKAQFEPVTIDGSVVQFFCVAQLHRISKKGNICYILYFRLTTFINPCACRFSAYSTIFSALLHECHA